MAATTFEPALARLLKDEGGYTNHPSDPGGPTNFGITLADARRYWKANASAADVKAMPIRVAKDIYRARYWDAQRCDQLPAGVDYAIFDYGVNSGIGRSGKVLRRCLGLADNTNAITADVVAACSRVDAKKLCEMIWSERLAFLKSLKTWPVFGKGWGNRVAGGRLFSQQLLSRGPVVITAPEPSPTPGKGKVSVNTKGQASAVVVATSTTALAATPGLPAWAVAVIIVGAAALAIGGIVFFKWRQKRAQEAPVAFTMEA